jgi:hypothetical protein
VQLEYLVRRIPAREAEELGEVAHPSARLERSGRNTADFRRSAGGADEAARDLDERRLAGAVRSEQSDELALANLEIDPCERLDPAVALREAAKGQSRGHA